MLPLNTSGFAADAMAHDESIGTCDLCGKEADANFEVRPTGGKFCSAASPDDLCCKTSAVVFSAQLNTLTCAILQTCHALFCTANCHREQGDIYHADCLKKVGQPLSLCEPFVVCCSRSQQSQIGLMETDHLVKQQNTGV